MIGRLILFSGMGGDNRLYRHIRIPDADTVTPNHVEPNDGETLPQYAARIADGLNIQPADVIGGISFGGMIAGEIAKQRPVAGLILLGSCLRPSRLPWSYKWAERIGRFVPDFAFRLRSCGPLLHWRFAPLTPEAAKCLVEMARTYPMSQLRGFGRMAVQWDGAANPSCPLLSIHGDWDRIIPLHCAESGLVLKDAGHAFTLTHAEQTVSAIREFLRTRVT
ncbi:MAG: alpha/beta hydrolase [Elusimicrobia bacterium]|nr:alpha/beta hydrolase [Elusimicrobiota bacterium]